MTTIEIKKALFESIVTFSFTKKDGSTRLAKGTTNPSLLSSKGGSSRGGENKVKNAGYVAYFDLDKNEWRCFPESKFTFISSEAI